MSDLPLTPTQFLDLTLYVCENGKCSGWSGMDWQTLSRYQFIAEPGNPPEGVTLYLADGWPVAVYAFDTGYTVISGAILTAL
ncbi:hypothetical protein [Pantoea agglomerans]